MLKPALFILLFHLGYVAQAQRTYAASSVLASGDWYKISVKEAGVYKVDAAFLKNLGIASGKVTSSSIRLFGNGGTMLPESCSADVIDDLHEDAIEVHDGGDGIFEGADYFL